MLSLQSESNFRDESLSAGARRANMLALFEGAQGLMDTVRLIERVGGIGLWKWDMPSGEMEWSPGFWNLLDLPQTSVTPSFRHLVGMMHPDDRASNSEIELLALKGLPIDRRFRIILRDGRLRWVEQRGEVLFDRDGRPAKAVGILIDVTTRQETLHAVRTKADRYQALRAAVSELVVVTNAEGAVIDLPDWCKATGQNIEDVQQASWIDALHGEDRPAARAKWDDARRRGAAFEVEARLLSLGGAYRWVNVRGAPITSQEGVIREWIVTVIDAPDVKTLAQADDQRLLSGAQIRAARAVLNWSVRDLAEKAGVPVSTIRRLEEFDGTLETPLAKASAIRVTLEQAGTEFIFPRTGKPGVRPR